MLQGRTIPGGGADEGRVANEGTPLLGGEEREEAAVPPSRPGCKRKLSASLFFSLRAAVDYKNIWLPQLPLPEIMIDGIDAWLPIITYVFAFGGILLPSKNEELLEQQLKEMKRQTAQRESQHKEQMEKMEQEHQQKLAEMRAEHTQTLAEMRAEHDQKMAAQDRQHTLSEQRLEATKEQTAQIKRNNELLEQQLRNA